MAQALTLELESFASELADTSRKILQSVGAAAPDVAMKSDASPVTETDRLVEQSLRDMIAERFPDHGILGEEYGSSNADAEYVWVIDPIDGTLAFIAGVPVYGTLIGLAHEGRPLFGVIDHPASRDRWTGGPGHGARWNGRPVQARRCADISQAFLTTSNTDLLSVDELTAFKRLKERARLTLYGASCYAYGLLASGRTDVGIDAGLDIFDMLAPAAVIEGAGGAVTDWNGLPLSLSWRGRVAAAGDRSVHEAVIALLASA